jgi:hypothetical protein
MGLDNNPCLWLILREMSFSVFSDGRLAKTTFQTSWLKSSLFFYCHKVINKWPHAFETLLHNISTPFALISPFCFI